MSSRLEVSMSELLLMQRCPRAWYYRYVKGLEPKEHAGYMDIGSAFHAGAAEIYRNYDQVREGLRDPHTLGAIGLSEFFNSAEHPEKINLDSQQIALVTDMIDYWWENQGRHQLYSEVLMVEEHDPILTVDGYSVRCTPDIVARREGSGQLVLIDHKTVGGVKESLAFLPLDFQLRLYALRVWTKYGEIPEVDYNMVRRELPPNFTRADGTKPYGLTPTGRPSTRTTDVADYLRLERQIFTPRQLRASETELRDILAERQYRLNLNRYTRNRIKSGAMACGQCDYFQPCLRELDGNRLDGLTLLAYDVKEPIKEPA